ncbi:hypothetical protein QQF64_006928 [Cirrhinus molitorella]|uniref:Uncharacterized protein n=1 Tax=Cirrhinus molitorella TaxID=172907 RepID=A0ABR3MDA5_9TELE
MSRNDSEGRYFFISAPFGSALTAEGMRSSDGSSEGIPNQFVRGDLGEHPSTGQPFPSGTLAPYQPSISGDFNSHSLGLIQDVQPEYIGSLSEYLCQYAHRPKAQLLLSSTARRQDVLE